MQKVLETRHRRVETIKIKIKLPKLEKKIYIYIDTTIEDINNGMAYLTFL